MCPVFGSRRPSLLIPCAVFAGLLPYGRDRNWGLFSTFLTPEQMRLKFIGSPNDRVAQTLDRQIEAANVFGLQTYILEQQGFRKVADTSFMIGFLISGQDVEIADVDRDGGARGAVAVRGAHACMTYLTLDDFEPEMKTAEVSRIFAEEYEAAARAGPPSVDEHGARARLAGRELEALLARANRRAAGVGVVVASCSVAG